jgi:hypothetical protein
MDKFWLNDPKVFIKSYLNFIPTKDMTIIQRYNAITLFCFYSLILMILFRQPIYWLYIPISVVIIIILLFYVKDTKQNNPSKETFDSIIESGYIDSDGNLRFNRVTNLPTTKPEVTFTCRKPTKDNPFMNPPISDFNTNAPEACNTDDENINNEITKAFKSDLYTDINDVFDKMNSQRQFYTVPNTSIPNNQTGFANWLYRTPVTCKEDQEQCLRYEDLRYKR